MHQLFTHSHYDIDDNIFKGGEFRAMEGVIFVGRA